MRLHPNLDMLVQIHLFFLLGPVLHLLHILADRVLLMKLSSCRFPIPPNPYKDGEGEGGGLSFVEVNTHTP